MSALLVCMTILAIGCNKKDKNLYQGKPVEEWVKMVGDDHPATKYAAINAIVEIGPPAKDAIPELVATIRVSRNADKKLLYLCNKALLGMGPEVVPAMIALLKDEVWEMRRGAAWLLGKLGPDAKDAIPALTRALKDPNASVRKKAEEALMKIKGEKATEELDSLNSGKPVDKEK